jgi:glycosyltransferase involved in cell wall biosynthesis
VVGVWPGKSENKFAATFADSLVASGCAVLDVVDPSEIDDRLDVLHIHWPEQVFWRRGGRFRKLLHALTVLRAIARMRRRGTKIVWMVHNLQPHDLKGPRRLMWPFIESRILRNCDAFMTLSPATISVVRNKFPQLGSKPAVAALHPLYPRQSDLPDQAACRQMVSLPAEGRVFALLGLIRPYKGTEALIQVFAATSDPDARLLIAGRAESSDYAERIRAMAAADRRIVTNLQFLSDRDFAVCLLAADALVLPYTGYLHSGAFAHALSYARPVITPAGPFANDMAEAVGSDWVFRYQGALMPQVLDDWSKPLAAPDLRALDPREVGRTAVALYRQILGAKRGATDLISHMD